MPANEATRSRDPRRPAGRSGTSSPFSSPTSRRRCSASRPRAPRLPRPRRRVRRLAAAPDRGPDCQWIADCGPVRLRRGCRPWVRRCTKDPRSPGLDQPLTARNQADRDLVSLVFSGLAKLGPGDAVVPDLASASWTVQKNGARYVVASGRTPGGRTDVPVTAADVVFTTRSSSSRTPTTRVPGSLMERDLRDGRERSQSHST